MPLASVRLLRLLWCDPHTGRLLAMSGGYDYRVSNSTVLFRRNASPVLPSSHLSIWPRLIKGYAPTTRILDAPLVVDQGQGKPKWKPANYTRRFYGPSIMRVGLIEIKKSHDGKAGDGYWHAGNKRICRKIWH